MKKIFWGIVYTVVVATALAHLSGCDMPSAEQLVELLTPAATSQELPKENTPTPVISVTEVPENNGNKDVTEGIKTCDDYVWTTGSVNLRKGAGTDHDKCGTVPGNTKVHRIGICDNGWILVEYKDITAYISGKYISEKDPGDVKTSEKKATPTVTPTIPAATSTPTATVTSAPKSTPTTAVITVQPTHGPSTVPVVDDVDGFLKTLTEAKSKVNTESAVDFYYETEKDATAAFVRNAEAYTTFSMLYKNKDCIHSPEYLMSVFPELVSIKVDREKSKVYSNAIYIVYETVEKEGGQYSYAIRTGDTSLLTKEEKWALKRVMELSDELGLKNMSEAELILAVHDYLINNTSYDSDYRSASHTPYGLLHNNTAVCDGYSETFMMFMLLNDIECQTVTGEAGEGAQRESHAWNQVRLDGQWYNIDVTWDDPVTRDSSTGNRVETLRHTYFLVNDEVIADTHFAMCGYENDCTSDRFLMYPYEKYLCNDARQVKETISAQLSNDMVYVVYKEGTINRGGIVEIFQSVKRGTVSSYEPEEVRPGYYMLRIINPIS